MVEALTCWRVRKVTTTDLKNDLCPRPLVRSMCDEDGAVLLDLQGGKYYSLNGIGAEIWTQMERGIDLDGLLAALRESYQVDEEVLKRDIHGFLGKLEKSGLIKYGAESDEV